MDVQDEITAQQEPRENQENRQEDDEDEEWITLTDIERHFGRHGPMDHFFTENSQTEVQMYSPTAFLNDPSFPEIRNDFGTGNGPEEQGYVHGEGEEEEETTTAVSFTEMVRRLLQRANFLEATLHHGQAARDNGENDDPDLGIVGYAVGGQGPDDEEYCVNGQQEEAENEYEMLEEEIGLEDYVFGPHAVFDPDGEIDIVESIARITTQPKWNSLLDSNGNVLSQDERIERKIARLTAGEAVGR